MSKQDEITDARGVEPRRSNRRHAAGILLLEAVWVAGLLAAIVLLVEKL